MPTTHSLIVSVMSRRILGIGDVILVTEHAPEVLCDVGATVPAGGGLVALGDEFQHADHPLISANPDRQRAWGAVKGNARTNPTVGFSKTGIADFRESKRLTAPFLLGLKRVKLLMGQRGNGSARLQDRSAAERFFESAAVGWFPLIWGSKITHGRRRK